MAANAVILMGLRASGKTTVGRVLAARLSYTFIDLDDLTAAELGEAAAGAALAKYGEPRFREAEAAVLSRTLGSATLRVVALGGGTPTGAASRQIIESARNAGTAVTIYLTAEPATLKQRLAADSTPRPSLTGRGTIDEVEHLYAQRDPTYRSLADHVFDAAQPPDAIAALIASCLVP